jgi:hypothetical protein
LPACLCLTVYGTNRAVEKGSPASLRWIVSLEFVIVFRSDFAVTFHGRDHVELYRNLKP